MLESISLPNTVLNSLFIGLLLLASFIHTPVLYDFFVQRCSLEDRHAVETILSFTYENIEVQQFVTSFSNNSDGNNFISVELETTFSSLLE